MGQDIGSLAKAHASGLRDADTAETSPGLSAVARRPPSLFELRRARKEKAAP
jgi:hypothetical protein